MIDTLLRLLVVLIPGAVVAWPILFFLFNDRGQTRSSDLLRCTSCAR